MRRVAESSEMGVVPPAEVHSRPELFAALDRMMEAGEIGYYGFSVERVEEGLKAIEYPNVCRSSLTASAPHARRSVFRAGSRSRWD